MKKFLIVMGGILFGLFVALPRWTCWEGCDFVFLSILDQEGMFGLLLSFFNLYGLLINIINFVVGITIVHLSLKKFGNRVGALVILFSGSVMSFIFHFIDDKISGTVPVFPLFYYLFSIDAVVIIVSSTLLLITTLRFFREKNSHLVSEK